MRIENVKDTPPEISTINRNGIKGGPKSLYEFLCSIKDYIADECCAVVRTKIQEELQTAYLREWREQLSYM